MKSIIKIIVTALSAAMLLSSCGTKNADNTPTDAPSATAEVSASPEATAEATPAVPMISNEALESMNNITIELTTGETITAELYPETAPITVANFKYLAANGFYDGLIFHRVINGFMIQGGGYDEHLKGKDAPSIKGEFDKNGVKNELKHTRGVLSMARAANMDSASSQFFIVHQDSPHLDGNYAAFGMVTEGMDVVDKIASAKTQRQGSMQDVPVEPIIIKSITLN